MQPVFIGGNVRSGTTLLADMLGCHPHISPIYETDFVLNLMQVLFGEPPEDPVGKARAVVEQFAARMPTLGQKRAKHERFAHGNSHLRFEPSYLLEQFEAVADEMRVDPGAAFRALVEAVFARHARNDGKVRWVNKTPANLQFGTGLQLLFPNMLLIHIVRDGRDVAASALTREFGANSVREAAIWWNASVEFGERFAERHPDQYLEVRYEALLRRPTDVLRTVFHAMREDLPHDLVPRWLDRVGGLDTTRMGTHRDVFTERDYAVFDQIAGAALRRCGYEADREPLHL